MSPQAANSLRLLALAGFASIMSMRVCDAMLPALASAFAASLPDAALSISAYAIAYGAMQLVYGPLADRHGRLRVIALAAGGCAVASVVAALATSLPLLVAARVAMGACAAAIVPQALAWIGDNVPLLERQAVLARYSGATLLGMTLGIWLGGGLTQALDWRAPFLALAPLFALASLLLLRGVRRAGPAPPAARVPYWQQVHAVVRLPWPRRVLVVAAIEGALGFGTLAFVPSVLHDRFALSLNAGGAVVALFAVGGLVYSQVAPGLLRRHGPRRVLLASVALMSLGFALLAVMPHWSVALVACGVGGIGFYGFHNVLQFTATQLSHTARGTAVSLFACSLFAGQSAGVTATAAALARWSPAVVYGATAAALGVLGLWFARSQQRRHAATEAAQA
ncbi:MAG: MFS transporter [Burkholderiales bacterium]